MAIGFGPGAEMHKAVNAQRGTGKRRSLKESSNQTLNTINSTTPLNYKKATQAQLDEIRERMAAEDKRNQIIVAIITVVFTITILVFALN